jgi:hypothetical protein
VTQPGADTVPGGGILPLIPGGGQPNGNLVIAAAGCYNFRVEAADVDAMTLEVTAGDGGLRRRADRSGRDRLRAAHVRARFLQRLG